MGKMTLRAVLAVAVLALVASPAIAKEFKDISTAAGVADDGLGKGVAFADINNDGLVDLYVSNKGGANKLYLNQGNGNFKDITATAGKGIDYPGLAMGSVFGDYDNDGCRTSTWPRAASTRSTPTACSRGTVTGPSLTSPTRPGSASRPSPTVPPSSTTTTTATSTSTAPTTASAPRTSSSPTTATAPSPT